MAKLGRTIFQPDAISNFLIKGYTSHTNGTVGDIVNNAMHNYLVPNNKSLKKEVEPLFYKIRDNEEISVDEMQGILARCVTVLKDFPIDDYYAIDQIMHRFRTGVGRALRFDYPLIVDDHSDAQLHRLNEIIKTINPDFNMGIHEFGERTRDIFNEWKELCHYSEIYVYIGTIIRLEKIYMKLDPYDTICLVKELDDAILNNSTDLIADNYPVNVTIQQKIGAIKYEILVYLADNGYATLSGDNGFEHKSDEVREYYHDLFVTVKDYPENTTENLEEYYEDLYRLEKKGRRIFTALAYKNPRLYPYGE